MAIAQVCDLQVVTGALEGEVASAREDLTKLNNLDAELRDEAERRDAMLALDMKCLRLRQAWVILADGHMPMLMCSWACNVCD